MSHTPLFSALAKRIEEKTDPFRAHLRQIAAGLPDVIPLGGGDPDFPTPAHITAAAKAAIDAELYHYTPPTGLPALRQAIAANLQRDNQLDYHAEEVMVTAGSQEAVMLSIMALVELEIGISAPRYTAYDSAIQLCGGVVVTVPTYEKDGFALVTEEIAARITPRTKVIVVVTPNNPTGGVTPPETIRQIAELAKQHQCFVISDELYERFIYEGSEHLSIASLPGMKERTITINGFSKAYAMTGWRVGYMAAPQDVIQKLSDARHTLSINTNTIAQHAALAALNGPQRVVEEMRAGYDERRRHLMDGLQEMGLSFGHPGGAYYLYVNVSSTGLSGSQFCERLLQDARVLIFPGNLFGAEDDCYVRIGYVIPLEQIKIAVARMSTVIARWRA